MARWMQALALVLLTAGPACAEEALRPTPEELLQARQAVRAAITSALSRYPGDSATSAMLGDLRYALSEGDVLLEGADVALHRLADGRGFLALPEFVALRDELQRYNSLLRAAQEPDLEEKYRQHVATLKRALANGTDSETAESYRWLAERGLAEALRHEVAKSFAQNNVVLRVSSASGNRILPNPFTQNIRQTTSFQGTPATVHGKLVAHSQLYAPPGGRRLDHAGINVTATVRTQVAMQREQMRISAFGTTQLFAQVLLEVQDNDFHIAGTTLNSRTSMSLGHVATQHCFGNRLVNRLAGRVFDRERAGINAQADQQIVAQGRPAMLAEVATIVEQINSGKNEVIAPIVAYGLTPQLGISSDPGGLNMMFRVATPLQLAAQTAPPQLSGSSYLAVHESAANNAGEMFAGRTLDEERFRETVFESLGFSPVQPPAPDENGMLHTVSFSRSQPLTAQFFSDRIKVRATVDGVSNGVEEMMSDTPVAIDVVYRFDTQSQGVVLVRESIDSPLAEPNKSIYEATLSRLLVPLARQEDVTTLGQLLSIVQLKADQPTASDGWLQMPLIER